jgi:hypothetical protein
LPAFVPGFDLAFYQVKLLNKCFIKKVFSS